MGDRSPAEFYFCEYAEAITILVTAGYGISVLPDYLVPDTPLIAKIPLTGAEPVSFGVYYKSVQGNPALKAFLNCARDCFAERPNSPYTQKHRRTAILRCFFCI